MQIPATVHEWRKRTAVKFIYIDPPTGNTIMENSYDGSTEILKRAVKDPRTTAEWGEWLVQQQRRRPLA